MSRVTVYEHEGQTLGYNPEDVEDIEVSTPCEVTGEVPNRELGARHLKLDITFKPGAQATWRKKED